MRTDDRLLGWGWMGWGPLPMLLFWAAVAIAVALLVEWIFTHPEK